MRAKVIGRADAGQAELFQDENGGTWHYAVDAMDGTVAVNEVTSGERNEPLGRAGVFRWGSDGEWDGDVYPAREGDGYGVNNERDYVVIDGEWSPAGE